MSKKLIVNVLKMRDGGWPYPRYQHAFAAPAQGVLYVQEESILRLNRHALVATLRHPDSGLPVEGLSPLIDARIIRATADEWVWTGIEHVMVGIKECDCAQTWVVRAVSLDYDEVPDPIP